MIDTILDVLVGGWIFWVSIIICGLGDLLCHLWQGGKLKDWQ